MEQTALILGASGLFGSRAAEAFAHAGWRVRRYQRGSDMARAAMGAQVIVNGLNPPNYHDWTNLIPKITSEVIAAARASGATVIVPGNVYVYANQPGPWGPDTPHRPTTRKGAVRATMEAAYERASRAGDIRVIILRGGDFIDPAAPASIMRMVVLKGLARGKITAMGVPDAARAYAYLPDMARVAVALADRRADLPAFADIPYAGLNFATSDLAAEISRQTGRPIKITRFPWWIMRLSAPFWELARELTEMRYLYSLPHGLDPAPLARLLPDLAATPFAEVVALHLKPLKAV